MRLGLVAANRFFDGGRPAGVVNLASGRLTAVRKFVEQAGVIMGMRADQMVFGATPARAEEIHHDPVSLRRLRCWFDWMPLTPVAVGIMRTWMFERGQEPAELAAV